MKLTKDFNKSKINLEVKKCIFDKCKKHYKEKLKILKSFTKNKCKQDIGQQCKNYNKLKDLQANKLTFLTNKKINKINVL